MINFEGRRYLLGLSKEVSESEAWPLAASVLSLVCLKSYLAASLTMRLCCLGGERGTPQIVAKVFFYLRISQPSLL